MSSLLSNHVTAASTDDLLFDHRGLDSGSTNGNSSSRSYISPEQRNLVESRFRKGVELSEFVPTFMACERVFVHDEEECLEAGTDSRKQRYINGSALSRRRAEWHGSQTMKRKTDNLLHLDDGTNDKNGFVPWRAVFTDRSLKEDYAKEWKSTILSETAHPRGGDPNRDESDGYYATFVHEYAPTGALLEARFRCDSQCDPIRIVAHEYKILENETDIRDWWTEHRRFSSHEQFFPRGLRLGGKLPSTLHEDGWETKMHQYL